MKNVHAHVHKPPDTSNLSVTSLCVRLYVASSDKIHCCCHTDNNNNSPFIPFYAILKCVLNI